MAFRRLLYRLIHDPELSDALLVISGPRQTGKTHLARRWLEETASGSSYFNWDDEKTRRAFRKDAHFFTADKYGVTKNSRVVFDEIHKIPRWKTLLKGFYDVFHREMSFLVTGSARLDMFRRSGDSMLGRYHHFRMYPLTPLEAVGAAGRVNLPFDEDKRMDADFESPAVPMETIASLLEFSGFPAPFLKASQRSLNLWRREYRSRVIREDLRDLTRIADVIRAENLMDLLPSRVASPLSLNSLRGDLDCSHDAVRAMINALKKLAVVFTVPPYSRKVQYALRKEAKLYFMDWTQIPDQGARFENFMAVQLQSWCDYVTDGGWNEMTLNYVRDKMKREADFLITRDGKPYLLVETKLGEAMPAPPALEYFSHQLGGVPAVCVTLKPGIHAQTSRHIRVVSAEKFFNLLWSRDAIQPENCHLPISDADNRSGACRIRHATTSSHE